MDATIKKNTIYAFGAQGLQFVRSILVSLLIPKLLGVEEFGFWQLFIFYTQYGGFLHFGIIDGIYLRIGGQHIDSLDYRILSFQFRFFLITQLVFTIPFIYLGYCEEDISRKFVIFSSCVFVLINNISTFYFYILQAVNHIKQFATGRVIITICFVVSLIILAILNTSDFQPYIIVYLCSYFVGGIYYLCQLKKLFYATFICEKGDTITQKNILLEDYKTGIVLLLSNLAGMFIVGFARFYIDGHWGITAFSIVSFAFMFVNFFMLFINQASLVLFPELRRWDEKRTCNFYKKYREMLSRLSPFVLIFYYPIVVFVHFWLPKYSGSLEYLVYLLPLCIFEFKMNMLCTTVFKVFNKINYIFKCNILALVVCIIGVCISGFVFDSLKGVVCAILLAIMVRSLGAEYVLSKKMLNTEFAGCLIAETFFVLIFIVANEICNSLYLSACIYSVSCILFGIKNRSYYFKLKNNE